jgi:hypothetical protein
MSQERANGRSSLNVRLQPKGFSADG